MQTNAKPKPEFETPYQHPEPRSVRLLCKFSATSQVTVCSTSFRFRIGRLEFNSVLSSGMACSCSLSSSGGGACSLSAAAGKPLRLLWSNVPHFGHEGSYGGPRVASGGAWNSSFRSWPIGKVHSIFSFGCNINAINVTQVKPTNLKRLVSHWPTNLKARGSSAGLCPNSYPSYS